MSKHPPGESIAEAIKKVAGLRKTTIAEVLSLTNPEDHHKLENTVLPVQLMLAIKGRDKEQYTYHRRPVSTGPRKRTPEQNSQPYDLMIFIRCMATNKMACLICKTPEETKYVLQLHSQLRLGGPALVEECLDSGNVLA
ncbi:hypothetical protein FOZ63_005860, partial [Perkinsus olseni]